MDLHANQIQGYFDIPVDHLLGMPILAKYFQDMHLEDPVVVSPEPWKRYKSKEHGPVSQLSYRHNRQEET